MTTKGTSTATKDVERVARKLTRRVNPLLHERLATLAAQGYDLGDIDSHTDKFVDAMLKALPAPTTAARVSGPVWTTEQVRKALGADDTPISRQAVADRVQRNTLLGLQVKERGERAYPLWQFAKIHGSWSVLPGLAGVLQAVPETTLDRWTLASWLQQPHPSLRGQSPLKALMAGREDEVMRAARALAERWSH